MQEKEPSQKMSKALLEIHFDRGTFPFVDWISSMPPYQMAQIKDSSCIQIARIFFHSFSNICVPPCHGPLQYVAVMLPHTCFLFSFLFLFIFPSLFLLIVLPSFLHCFLHSFPAFLCPRWTTALHTESRTYKIKRGWQVLHHSIAGPYTAQKFPHRPTMWRLQLQSSRIVTCPPHPSKEDTLLGRRAIHHVT